MDNDAHAHVYQDLIFNDIPGDPSLYPRVVFSFIPAEYITHDLMARAFTEYAFDSTPLWDIECCDKTLFKIAVDSAGFHEECVVALEPGHRYSLATLMGGGGIILLSGLQKIYSTYHEVACRNLPKRPFV